MQILHRMLQYDTVYREGRKSGRTNSIVRSRIHLGEVIDRSVDGGGGIEE